MTHAEYEKKLNTFTKKALINYILSISSLKMESTLSTIESIERSITYQIYEKKSDEALEEIKTSTRRYKEFIDSLKKKYEKETLSLKDLTSSEIERLSSLDKQIDLACKKFDEAQMHI